MLFNDSLNSFLAQLKAAGKSKLTLEKYERDLLSFFRFQGDRPLEKELLVAYKQHLLQVGYAPQSINSMLAAVHSYAAFLGQKGCRVKRVRLPKKELEEEKKLHPEDLARLLSAARQNPRLFLLLKVLSQTEVRFPELAFLRREDLEEKVVVLKTEKETRKIRFPSRLRKELLAYAEAEGIQSGPLFLSRNGYPLNRSNLWHSMKDLAVKAGVDPQRINARSLRRFYIENQKSR